LRYTGNNTIRGLIPRYFFGSPSKGAIVVNLSIDIARRIVDACRQRAMELRSPVSIAIVDAGGYLVLFERMMSPYGWATAHISIAKANTAVMFNQSTDSVAQWGSSIPGFASSMAAMTQGKFIMAAGGWPIRWDGTTIGGIGVSGGNAPGRDDDIARAGLAVVEAMAPAAPVRAANIPPQSPARPFAPPSSQVQPAPAYPSIPVPSSPSASVSASQNVSASTRHLEQDDSLSDTPVAFDHYSENNGGNHESGS
jgi:uncharacterized protein GlcG (DUF336 family)